MDNLRARPLMGATVGCMLLKVAAGWLDLLASSIVCQLQDGNQTIVCTIARQVLRAISQPIISAGQSLRKLYLANVFRRLTASRVQKSYGRGLDENGEISIGPADLFRYGFGAVFQFGTAEE
jgi:hypothetical protein